MEFLCGLLGNILLWLRNRLGFRKHVAQAVSYDKLGARFSGHAMTLMSRASSVVSARP